MKRWKSGNRGNTIPTSLGLLASLEDKEDLKGSSSPWTAFAELETERWSVTGLEDDLETGSSVAPVKTNDSTLCCPFSLKQKDCEVKNKLWTNLRHFNGKLIFPFFFYFEEQTYFPLFLFGIANLFSLVLYRNSKPFF